MSLHDKKIYPGQGVRVRGEFRDPATNILVDPGSVNLIFRRPDGVETMVAVTRNSLGYYSGRMIVDQPGRWFWRMDSTSPGEAAKEGAFQVVRSVFT